MRLRPYLAASVCSSTGALAPRPPTACCGALWQAAALLRTKPGQSFVCVRVLGLLVDKCSRFNPYQWSLFIKVHVKLARKRESERKVNDN